MPEGDSQDEFIPVDISYVGFIDQFGLEGMVVLKNLQGDEFPIRAFSGEVAKHISRFRDGDKTTIPTIYNLIEEISVLQDLLLIEVRIYRTGSVLRSNLYFKTRKDVITLTNYRASDSIALAAFFDVPIKIRRELFEET
ncbi:MAG: bifunctional nuclease domain-containing protein, partial [Nitrososphaeraceae archaeon]